MFCLGLHVGGGLTVNILQLFGIGMQRHVYDHPWALEAWITKL